MQDKLNLTSNNRITPEKIISLNKDEIFVFGSNLAGIHGAGAARTAVFKFGAINGKGSGLQGKSYGIPTKNRHIITLNIDKIKPHINRFIKFAIKNPNKTFLVTEVGCGLAGYKPKEIAPLFKEAINVENIHLPQRFWDVINKKIIC